MVQGFLLRWIWVGSHNMQFYYYSAGAFAFTARFALIESINILINNENLALSLTQRLPIWVVKMSIKRQGNNYTTFLHSKSFKASSTLPASLQDDLWKLWEHCMSLELISASEILMRKDKRRQEKQKEKGKITLLTHQQKQKTVCHNGRQCRIWLAN